MRNSIFTFCLLMFASFFLGVSNASAQSAKDLVGTWKFVVNETTRADGTKFDTYGHDPKGLIMFDSGGRFSLFIARPDPVKFASNSRLDGTPDEYKAAIQGAISYYGTYAVNEEDKTVTFQIEASSFPNWYGAVQKRPFSISGDELRFTNAAGSSGGSVLAVLKRL